MLNKITLSTFIKVIETCHLWLSLCQYESKVKVILMKFNTMTNYVGNAE